MSHVLTGHLGDLGAALVDDQLGPATRDLVLGHVAGCADCRRDVEQQRQLKARLRALAEPGLPPTLLTSLRALGQTSCLSSSSESTAALPAVSIPGRTPGRDLPAVLALVPAATGRSEGARALRRPGILHDSGRGRRLLAGAASLVLVGTGTAYAAAGSAQAPSLIRPAGNAFTTGHAVSSGPGLASVPLSDPAFAAMTASFGR